MVSSWLHTLVILLLFLGKEPPVPLDRRLDGPQSQSGHVSEDKNSYSCQESNPDLTVLANFT